MEVLTKAAWIGLAAIHAMPSLALFMPSLIQRLYGVPSSGSVGILLTHRGALFLGVFALALLAAFDEQSRAAGVLVVGISMVGFLIVYAHAGSPAGALRTIALTDLVGLPLLALVTWEALQR
ncbi:MAG: hypothetical protein B7Y43_18235 [Sphingomonas sp. 28-62-20]|uniref:hypothetical protein n=1 Tax=Sphingomonas sp. 28-62-20 TaxID=1970433 RepID=UPI000BD21AC6|nr:MAG: hypothetical protein B7Y43_18235 [Sphingomonas sp. 28-62-20]